MTTGQIRVELFLLTRTSPEITEKCNEKRKVEPMARHGSTCKELWQKDNEKEITVSHFVSQNYSEV